MQSCSQCSAITSREKRHQSFPSRFWVLAHIESFLCVKISLFINTVDWVYIGWKSLVENSTILPKISPHLFSIPTAKKYVYEKPLIGVRKSIKREKRRKERDAIVFVVILCCDFTLFFLWDHKWEEEEAHQVVRLLSPLARAREWGR